MLQTKTNEIYGWGTCNFDPYPLANANLSVDAWDKVCFFGCRAIFHCQWINTPLVFSCVQLFTTQKSSHSQPNWGRDPTRWPAHPSSWPMATQPHNLLKNLNEEGQFHCNVIVGLLGCIHNSLSDCFFNFTWPKCYRPWLCCQQYSSRNPQRLRLRSRLVCRANVLGSRAICWRQHHADMKFGHIFF